MDEKLIKPINVSARNILEAKHIFESFSYFTTGVRVLFLIHRSKEGGETNNSKFRKIITRTKKEYLEELEKLVVECNESELPLRIYGAVNERDVEKAIRQFKGEQLDADYFDTESKHSFYLDCKNRFLGSLMSPNSRVKGNASFLIDIDGDKDTIAGVLQLIPPEVEIIKQYPTKNGWHIVVKPFNVALMEKVESPFSKDFEIKKDGLLLLKFKV